MAHYYDISLKNTRRVEAREVRLNGLLLAGLHAIREPGRLEFVTVSSADGADRGLIGGFKSMTGIDTELEVIDPASPGLRRRLTGRVASAITHQAEPSTRTGEYETVTFIFNKID